MASAPKNLIKRAIISPIREFIQDSRSIGIVLICCTVISLFISNSGWSAGYLHFWEQQLAMPVPNLHLPHTPLHLINDGLMTLFFFLVGLEIKRELLVGELATVRKSMLPIFSALGGMVVPAVVYLLWTHHTPFSSGWGVPMATDIAFSLGVLSLLGKRAPMSLKVFLTALAIIDDLGAIVAIAIFYTDQIQWMYLALSGGLLFVLALLNLFKVHRSFIYLIFGFFLWYFVFNSGIHATIAGVLLAFTIPLRKIGRLEHALHDPVNFVIMPLFALANTAIVLPDSFGFIFQSDVHHGILMGLIAGKPVGIFLFALIAVRLGFASLPAGMNWKQLWGTGMIAGIGFTMSIFIATLAFDLPGVQLIAKVAVIMASLISGIAGFLFLRLLNGKVQRKLQRSAD